MVWQCVASTHPSDLCGVLGFWDANQWFYTVDHEALSADATWTEDDKAVVSGAVETKRCQYRLVEAERGKIWFGFVTDGRAGI